MLRRCRVDVLITTKIFAKHAKCNRVRVVCGVRSVCECDGVREIEFEKRNVWNSSTESTTAPRHAQHRTRYHGILALAGAPPAPRRSNAATRAMSAAVARARPWCHIPVHAIHAREGDWHLCHSTPPIAHLYINTPPWTPIHKPLDRHWSAAPRSALSCEPVCLESNHPCISDFP